MSATLALQEQEIQQEINKVVAQILESGSEVSSLTQVQVKQMLALFVKWPKLFQTQLISLIDRLVCLDGEDSYLRNMFRLYERLYV